MDSFQTLIFLMSLAVILVGVATRLRIPYPITLVLGGAALGFTPGLSEIDFDPYLVLLIVLPPILYYAAYSISYKELKKNLNEILWLALGLVIVTTVAIGLLFKWFFPELPWALSFAFGAIIAPPDAIAAVTILKRFSIRPQLLTILEGESLINDATGLVLYKLALMALFSGSFFLSEASLEFLKVAGGGILIGVITGYLFHAFSSRFFDPILSVVYAFTIPYMTFILADAIEVSGVLAVVVNGLIGSRMLITHFPALTRIVGWASWDILIIFLNCFVFILIGLQLRGIIQRLTFNEILLYIGYGFVFTAAIIFVRFVWVFIREGITYFKKKNKPQEEVLCCSTLISWSGMRGIVSLTLALALPFTMPDGSPLPGRDIIVFLTFVIILLTLLIPSFTLLSLTRWLKVTDPDENLETDKIRNTLLKTVKEEIEHLEEINRLDKEEAAFLLNYFNVRHQVLDIALKANKRAHSLESARKHILNKKRYHLIEMWKKNEINDVLFNILEYEIDLEEAYLARRQI